MGMDATEAANLRIDRERWRALALSLERGVDGDHLDPHLWRIWQQTAGEYHRRLMKAEEAIARADALLYLIGKGLRARDRSAWGHYLAVLEAAKEQAKVLTDESDGGGNQ